MLRVFMTSAGALLLGTCGAFFLFVPLLSIATVACVLLGLVLMFALGVQVGIRQSSEETNRD